ncbi:MAG: tetratricopeptide repeat protein [Candidatus Omnitrophica bacterium]|nr:tetratricopeptide repeat protein [Candidatus Omnitrophota bacterium]
MKNRSLALFIFMLFISGLAFASSPEDLKQKFADALNASSQQNYDKAKTLLEEIIAAAPNFAEAYYYLGLVYKEQGNMEKSAEVFNQAVDKNPQCAECYDNLSKYYYMLKDFDKAAEFGNKAVLLKPGLTSSHLTLGWVYLLGKEDPDSAIDHFKIVTDQGNIKYALLGLGMAYYMTNQNFKTLEMITRLRNIQEDKLAQQLEEAIRKGPYQKPPKQEDAAPAVDKEPVPVPESPNDQTGASQPKPLGKSYKVRLRAPYQTGAHTTITDDLSNQDTVTGEDRVKMLQQQGKDLKISY